MPRRHGGRPTAGGRARPRAAAASTSRLRPSTTWRPRLLQARPDGVINSAISRLARLLGSEFPGRVAVAIAGRRARRFFPVLGRLLHHTRERQVLAAEEVGLRTKHGNDRILLRSTKLLGSGGKGERRVAGTLIGITERKRRESDLDRLAFEDPLTGLANRRALDEHERAWLLSGPLGGGRSRGGPVTDAGLFPKNRARPRARATVSVPGASD